ncbi:MAG: hypothetical protein MJY56_01880 [Bacteroidales bacterium]|nr:hypothetical protein [Bacteroidales bacterium]
MKKIIVSLVILFVAASALKAQPLSHSSKPTGAPIYGIGLEMDPVWIGDDVANHGLPEEDWDRVYAPRIKSTGVKRFRMMIIPSWYEKTNDDDDPYNYNWDGFDFSEEGSLKMLYKELDLVEEIGGEALLVIWGCPFNHFLRDPEGGNHWVCRTGDDEEVAENFTALIKYLIEVKGYTCVKEATLYNEPECGVSPMGWYDRTCRVFEARLRREGLRDKIRFNCSDNTDTRRFFLEQTVERVGDIADMYNSHTYLYDCNTTNSTIYNWEKRNVEACKGRPHYVCEFGLSNGNGLNATSTATRGVTLTRLALNFLNAGASGASLWIAYDQHYGGLHNCGLWHSLASLYPDEEGLEDYAVRPQYYSYSLMARFIPIGSKVYPVDLGNEFAASSYVEAPDGSKTWIFANGNEESLSFEIPAEGAYDVYVFSSDTLPADDSQIEASSVLEPVGGAVSVEIPAWSVIYLNTKK